MIGVRIVEDILITNMKRIYSIKDNLNYKVNPQSVKSNFLLYKNDFKFQLGFKVFVKNGNNIG